MMRVLVTGGAGYIGSHAVRALLASGHEAWAYDNLHKGHRQAVPEGRLVVGDLRDSDLLDQTLIAKRIDAVMHFAALAEVGESSINPGTYYLNNVVYTHNLLERMRKQGLKKIVFSSTCATYGIPNLVPIHEDHPQQPINPYGRTKLMIEQMINDYVVAYGFSCTALRYFNAAGAAPGGAIGEDHTPESHLIPICIAAALGKRPKVSIFGTDYPTADGTCIRDYIHVDDLASAHVMALEKSLPGTMAAYNLGIGRGYSVREVIATVEKVSGRKIAVEESPARPGDPPQLVADTRKVRNVFGWMPQYLDLEEIVSTAWDWHRTHPEGYRSQGKA